jgi:hypothetical protein
VLGTRLVYVRNQGAEGWWKMVLEDRGGIPNVEHRVCWNCGRDVGRETSMYDQPSPEFSQPPPSPPVPFIVALPLCHNSSICVLLSRAISPPSDHLPRFIYIPAIPAFMTVLIQIPFVPSSFMPLFLRLAEPSTHLSSAPLPSGSIPDHGVTCRPDPSTDVVLLYSPRCSPTVA